MNSDLDKLQPYPFEKLSKLLGQLEIGPQAPIPLSIGEPKHKSPDFVVEALVNHLDKLEKYPSTKGLPELRESIVNWATRRFHLPENSLDPEQHVLPVNGTREAIFSFTQAVIDRSAGNALVISPNPFYQIYEGATFLAGAELRLLPCLADNNFCPDFTKVSDNDWKRCQILFLCSPGNPTGSVIPSETLRELLELADKYDFIIASDECYSEIYCDESKPPVGLLQVCGELGRSNYERVVVFHSLSKRSNLPGLRSGFVAGDASVMSEFLRYRTYHGSAMPIQNQFASIAAWNDEQHVKDNRSAYREKFKAVLDILSPVMDIQQSDASFYLWPKTPICDQVFAKELYQQQAVTVVPGSYLSRTVDGTNPGQGRIRIALVAPIEQCIEAAKRIRTYLSTLDK